MLDVPTIKNIIRKRVPSLIETVVTPFLDATGLAVAVEVDGRAYPILFRLPLEVTRVDVLNAIDAIADTVVRIRRDRPSPADYMRDRHAA